MGWEIQIGAAGGGSTASLLTAVLPPLLAGLVALGGVWLGGFQQRRQAVAIASAQREERLADEKAERDREEAKLEAERDFVRLVLAFHLEKYAKACAEVIGYNHSDDKEGAMVVPDFPKWPDVEWQLLGAPETAKARDIEARVHLRKSYVEGDIEYSAVDDLDARKYYSNGAARIGAEAWNVASQLRAAAKVAPFEFPDFGWNYTETLLTHLSKLDDEQRKKEGNSDGL
ncbi:MAG TPA: hypothetical protein VF699_10825 [Caulobacteraceae bacterium]|jgi:hypothetical protein